MPYKKVFILIFILLGPLAYAASELPEAGTSLKATPTITRSLPMTAMLSCSTPEEAHAKAAQYMDAHIHNLQDFIEYLNSSTVSSEEKYNAILERYSTIILKKEKLCKRAGIDSSSNQYEAIESFVGFLSNDLSIWQNMQKIFMDIYQAATYRYEPEQDMTALDILYMQAFMGSVQDAMAEKDGHLPGKLSFQDVEAYITTQEKVMEDSNEEYFDFIYRWQLARILRPFLSPLYLTIERLEPYRAVYEYKKQTSSCYFAPRFIIDTMGITTARSILNFTYDEAKDNPSLLKIQNKILDLSETPFYRNALNYVELPKKSDLPLMAKIGNRKVTKLKDGDIIYWAEGEGSFLKGYSRMDELAKRNKRIF